MCSAVAPRSRFEFSKNEILQKFVEHWDYADRFIKSFAELVGVDPEYIEVDERRLQLAVKSAYDDIARYKNYHQDVPETELLDCTKRCAFLLKWIMKFKPINAPKGDINDKKLDYMEFINEAFSLYLFDLHLSEEIDLNVCLSIPKTQQLGYDLMYRQISTDGWIAIFQMVKECAVDGGRDLRAPFIELLPV